MTFVDHVSDPDNLKTAPSAVLPALTRICVCRQGQDYICGPWVWNGGGPGSGWICGDAESLSVQNLVQNLTFTFASIIFVLGLNFFISILLLLS